MAEKSVKLSTSSFRDIPICELCLEDALKAGAAKTNQLKPGELKETSMRFCVDGLYDWLRSFAKHYGESSPFGMIRDLSWYWASFCSTDKTMIGLITEYYSLLKDLTENTDYTDLVKDMNEPVRVEKIDRAGPHITAVIPFPAYGAIQDCAMALGTSFSVFYQLGLSKALASDSQGRYRTWATAKFIPLFDEFMKRSKAKLRKLKEIRRFMLVRLEDYE